MITTTGQLEDVCDAIRAAGAFALDMEFSREKTYRARLELIQVATEDRAEIIDPLAGLDLTPLWDVICDPAVETVVHAGMQDLEIAYHASRRVPQGIFDTQVAAALVGFADQVAYTDLVRKLAGARLSKTHSRTDWTKRPLSDKQIEYALDDVRYLLPARHRLAEMLRDRGRESWVAEEMAHLKEEVTFADAPELAYRSVKGFGKLGRRELAVLRELAAWREREALRRDHPRRWVMADDVILDIARRAPTTREEIEGLRRLPDKVLDRHVEELIEATRRALEMPPEQWPAGRGRRPDAGAEAAAELGMAFVRIRAAEADVASPVLASPADVVELATAVRRDRMDPPPVLLTGWRRELVGEDLVRLVSGEISLRFDPGTGRVDATG